MAHKNPQDVMEKWARNLGAATATMTAGVGAVTESPSRVAAGRLDAYLEGINRALADGSTKAAMEAVTTEEWQESMREKGIPHAVAAARSPKAQANTLHFLDQFLPFVHREADIIKRNNTGTDLASGIARAVAMMEKNASFKMTRR